MRARAGSVLAKVHSPLGTRTTERKSLTILKEELPHPNISSIDADQTAHSRHGDADGCHGMAKLVVVGRVLKVGRDALGRSQRWAIEDRILLLLGQVWQLVHGDR